MNKINESITVDNIKIGDIVYHPIFGKGVVENIRGDIQQIFILRIKFLDRTRDIRPYNAEGMVKLDKDGFIVLDSPKEKEEKIRWYKKGKLYKDEDWNNESSTFIPFSEFKPETKKPKYRIATERQRRIEKMKDIDPYGEEDWVTEKKWFRDILCLDDDELRIGDKCIFKADKKGSSKGLYDKIGYKCTIIYCHSNSYIITFEGDLFGYNCGGGNLTKIDKKKLEQLKKKHLDIDPYGEEDWMTESVNDKIEVGDVCIFKADDKGATIGLSSKVGQDCTVVSVPVDWGTCGIKFNKNDRNIYGCRIGNLTKLDQLDQEEYYKLSNDFKLKHLDIDPYGEEEWYE